MDEPFASIRPRATGRNCRLTVEIGNWVLAQNEVDITFDHVEVVDLVTGKIHRRNKGRPSTITALKTNGRIIETLWSSV
jgi:hypothetical protein